MASRLWPLGSTRLGSWTKQNVDNEQKANPAGHIVARWPRCGGHVLAVGAEPGAPGDGGHAEPKKSSIQDVLARASTYQLVLRTD